MTDYYEMKAGACRPDFTLTDWIENMNVLRKIDRILSIIRKVVLVGILISTVSMCTVNIILRYIVRSEVAFRPFPWVNEVMQVSAIWVAFLAAGLGVRNNSHVSLDSLVKEHLPEKIYKPLKTVAQVIVIVTLALLLFYGIKTTIFMKRSYLQNVRISYAWFYSAIPVGCFYLLYEYILILIFGKNPFLEEEKNTAPEASSGAF